VEERIEQAGGVLIESLDELGIVVADFSREEDAKITEDEDLTVMPDLLLNWLLDDRIPEGEHIELNDNFYGFQWHLPVIKADKAWERGASGAGVRVAVVDTGIWYHHPDLRDNIDFNAGATFVPGTDDFLDDEGHGTHVAGIIAAADDNWGTVGVAPKATLIGIKVLAGDGTGRISWIVDGIVHAVNQKADIINLSMGSYLNKNGNPPYYTGAQAAQLRKMVRKAVNWAASKGVIVVHSAGNLGLDFDHLEGDLKNVISIPTEEGNGIVVSATGPIGLKFFDTPASYTNYGSSVIWLAAPGGDYRYYPYYGWWNDMVLSTSINGWMRAAGTSMSAAVVSGTAALVLERYGPMKPMTLKNHLARTADDLGKKGVDPYFGHGRINAFKAVTR
jgi:subtilisin family serine protease